MSEYGIVQQHLTTIEMDGKPCDVSVRIAYDGIEYIGRLFFSDPSTGQGIPDHGAIPGRTVEEAVQFARRLTSKTSRVAIIARAPTSVATRFSAKRPMKC